jgi:hypothetical protein
LSDIAAFLGFKNGKINKNIFLKKIVSEDPFDPSVIITFIDTTTVLNFSEGTADLINPSGKLIKKGIT